MPPPPASFAGGEGPVLPALTLFSQSLLRCCFHVARHLAAHHAAAAAALAAAVADASAAAASLVVTAVAPASEAEGDKKETAI